MRVTNSFAAILSLAAALALPAGVLQAQTLKTVQERGTVLCGVNEGLPGFSAPGGKDNWSGFDVDFCRAVAAAVFDDPGKVTFVPLSVGDRFDALRDGKVDLLSRNSTWTMGREVELGLLFAGITYYDGQGFLIGKRHNVLSAFDLRDKSVCVRSGTTTELNLADFFNENRMAYKAVALEQDAELLEAYDGGKCEVLTADVSQLYAQRMRLKAPDEHEILPDVISKEPLGPVVRQNDLQWFNIVKWTHFAMLNAEELGVFSHTVDEAMQSKKPDVQRLLGREGSFGEKLGLGRDWAARIVRHVGNYGEVFERNVGADSRLGIPRGMNHLWNMGGIQYAPPIR